METLLLVGQFLTIAAVGAALLFLKHHLPSYMAKKGENLATKEDVAEITRLVEATREPFATAIEAFKHNLQEQRRVFSERQKLYIEFTQAAADVFLSGRGAAQQSISRYHSAFAAIQLSAPDHVTRAINQHLAAQIAAKNPNEREKLQPLLRQTYADLILAMRKDAFDAETTLTVDDIPLITVAAPGSPAGA